MANWVLNIIILPLSIIFMIVVAYLSVKGMSSPEPDDEEKKNMATFYKDELQGCESHAKTVFRISIGVTVLMVIAFMVYIFAFTSGGRGVVKGAVSGGWKETGGEDWWNRPTAEDISKARWDAAANAPLPRRPLPPGPGRNKQPMF